METLIRLSAEFGHFGFPISDFAREQIHLWINNFSIWLREYVWTALLPFFLLFFIWFRIAEEPETHTHTHRKVEKGSKNKRAEDAGAEKNEKKRKKAKEHEYIIKINIILFTNMTTPALNHSYFKGNIMYICIYPSYLK